MKFNRREFVASSSAALVSAAGGSVKGSVKGANERLRGALIGCGGMGRANLNDFLKLDDVEIVAVCDVWEFNRQRAAAMTEGQSTGRAREFKDFRQVIDRQDIDFVVVATPDHWHAIPTVRACESGKDVYVEKPLAHNIREGRMMADTARKFGRIVQMGTQQRSGEHYQEAVQLIREGGIGKVSRVHCWNFENESPGGIGNPADSAPPENLDWEMWLGPAPRVPFNGNRFIGSFRWYWDYAGGKMTDWGTHHLDIIQWAMDVKGPISVSAMGGKYVLQDNRETPDTLEVILEYPGFITTYGSRVCNSRDVVGSGYGIEFFGTDGTLFLDRAGYEVFPEYSEQSGEREPGHLSQMKAVENPRDPWERPRRQRRGRTEWIKGEGSEQHLRHVRNFVDCVKSRELSISDVETGHRSTTAAHLGNISLRAGRRIYWDPENESIRDDAEASKLLTREYRSPWIL